MASKRKGLSSAVLVQNALMSISRVDRYQNKWMPDSKWVDLIIAAYGDSEEPYESLTAAKLNKAVGRNTELAAGMDNKMWGNQWGLFRHLKYDGKRNVTCYIAVERNTPLGSRINGKVWWEGVTEHQNPVRLFGDKEAELFADDALLLLLLLLKLLSY